MSADSGREVVRVGDAIVVALLAELRSQDPNTHDHCRSTGAWSGLLAKHLGFDESGIKAAILAGTLHDIGKIDTPSDILRKPGALNAEEWAIMREHAVAGEKRLAHIPELSHLAPILRWHHERVDGRGYPDRLAGERIPMLARVVAVADSFHAMISNRPYRKALPVGDAIRLLDDGRGTQWDVDVIAAMQSVLATKTMFAAERRIAKNEAC